MAFKFKSPISKAIFAGGSSGLLAGFGPFLLTFFNLIEPVTTNIATSIPVFGPVLGVVVGLGTALVTWLSPKNAAPKKA